MKKEETKKEFTKVREVKEETKTLEEEFAEYGRCIGGGCHQCKFYDICPTGQMSEY